MSGSSAKAARRKLRAGLDGDDAIGRELIETETPKALGRAWRRQNMTDLQRYRRQHGWPDTSDAGRDGSPEGLIPPSVAGSTPAPATSHD